jgi:diguanylate cyclase (GGDEF)-like protein/PAS domain S-box-containing protein
LTVTGLFFYFYQVSQEQYQEEKITLIKGDLLELGYSVAKAAEQGEINDALNLLYRSIATHKSYRQLHIVVDGEVLISTNPVFVGNPYRDGEHLDNISPKMLHVTQEYFHEFDYFAGGVKERFELAVDIDTVYLHKSEREMLWLTEQFLMVYFVMTVLVFTIIYFLNIRPILQLQKAVREGSKDLPQFRLNEFRQLRDAFKEKFDEIAALNTNLELKIQERTETLRKTNKLFAEAEEMTSLGNWEWDIVNNTLVWSDQIYRIFGLRPQEFAATYDAFLNTIHREDRKMVESAVANTLESGEDYTVTHRIVLPDGSERKVIERGKVERNEQGENLRMLGTVQDITEQHEREEALRLQAGILDSVSDAIFVHPMGGEFIYVNDAACKTRGFSRDELLGMSVAELDAPHVVPEEERENHVNQIKEQIERTGAAVFEMEHRKKSGGTIPVEINSRIFNLEGESYFISIARDISERKRILNKLEASEEKYRSIVENSLVGVFKSDLGGSLHYVNDAAVKILEFDSAEEMLKAKTTMFYKEPEVRQQMLGILKENGSISSYEIEVLTNRKKVKTLLFSATLEGTSLSGTVMDITEEKKARREVARLSRAVEQIDDLVLITDRSGLIEYVNDAFVEHTGYGREEVYGKNARLLKSGEHDQSFYKGLWSTILSGNVFKERVINRKKNGEIFYEQKTITPIKDKKGNIVTFVSTGKDITQTVEMEQRLEQMAMTDKLTGIHNRHRFEELYNIEVARVLRYENSLAMIMFDIDHFKQVNDTYGHDVGDNVLKQVVEVVSNCIRKVDVFARWGGEEFLVLCPETSAEDAMVLANKMRREIEHAKFETVGSVQASFGVSEFVLGENRDNLFKRVDNALYMAKEKGRNRVEGDF